MRLAVLDNGHGFGTKLLFAMIRLASRQPVLDVIKLVRYRAQFYGAPMARVTHEAMRGPSSWSVGDRELMAAIVANSNRCAWCTQAHGAVARRAYGDATKVAAALADLDTAPLAEPLRATLRMLATLSRTGTIGAGEMRAVLAAGATRVQVRDALAVAFAFNVTGRLADAFGFADPGAAAFESGAKYLLARGYR